MIAEMLKTLAQVITRTGSEKNVSTRNRRSDRRYPLGLGLSLEGLEMRLAPSGIAPVLVTVTNQPPVSSPTPTRPTGSTTIFAARPQDQIMMS